MTDSTLRRVAFVTRHYAELRAGVTRAAAAPLLILLTWTGLPGAWQGTLACIGFTFTSGVLDRWMDRRFGRVLSDANQTRILALGLLALVMIFGLDRRAAGGGLSLLLLAAATFGLWLTVQLWPYGACNLLPTLLAAGFAFQFTGLDSAEALAEWQERAYPSTLFAWTMAGLFDLMLLEKLLPGGRAAEADEAIDQS